MSKSLVYGVGINDVESPTFPEGGKKKCHYYARWHHMMERCYSVGWKVKYPTYIDCVADTKWHKFSAFKSWVILVEGVIGMSSEGLDLDKDLLSVGNKSYSPNTCVLIHPKVNRFIVDKEKVTSKHLQGVSWAKHSKKYFARCSNTLTGEREYLGLFDNEVDAHNAWCNRKREVAGLLIDSEYVTTNYIRKALSSLEFT